MSDAPEREEYQPAPDMPRVMGRSVVIRGDEEQHYVWYDFEQWCSREACMIAQMEIDGFPNLAQKARDLLKRS